MMLDSRNCMAPSARRPFHDKRTLTASQDTTSALYGSNLMRPEMISSIARA
jgi:hypothetical protein